MTVQESNAWLQEAAVLVPLYRGGDGVLRLVLVRRSDEGIHGGEIAFPGGKRMPADQTPLDTAIRETREEIGINKEAIEVIEHLPVVETQTTGFRIFPFLARIVPPPEWIREEREIAEILEVPIDDLTHPDSHGEEMKSFPLWPKPQRIFFYRVDQYKLWGATYRILHPLLSRLVSGEWSV